MSVNNENGLRQASEKSITTLQVISHNAFCEVELVLVLLLFFVHLDQLLLI